MRPQVPFYEFMSSFIVIHHAVTVRSDVGFASLDLHLLCFLEMLLDVVRVRSTCYEQVHQTEIQTFQNPEDLFSPNFLALIKRIYDDITEATCEAYLVENM